MKRLKGFIFILTVLLIAAASCLQVSAESKAPEGSIIIEPAYVDVVLSKKDQQSEIDLYFTNNSAKAISLAMSAIDFKQKEDTGIVTFLGVDEKEFSYSLASFLRFETNRVELEPREKKMVKVYVTNRSDVSPGGHYAAVLGTLIQSDEATSNVVSPSVSSLIFLEKQGGERYSLKLKEAQWPENDITFSYPYRINLVFSNEGNIHLIPYGRVEVKDIWGRLLSRGVINEGSARILPETRRILTAEMAPISRSFPISINTISVAGQDSLKKTSYFYRKTFFFIDPLLAGLVAVALVTFGYLRYKQWRKRK